MVKSVMASPVTGLLTTRAELQLQLKQQHFHKGQLSAKCLASILTMHWQSQDIRVMEETPATLAAASSSSKAKDESKDQPSDQATKLKSKTKPNPISALASRASGKTEKLGGKHTHTRRTSLEREEGIVF